MELKTYFAQDASGNIMPGATVTVYEAGTATLATGLQDESGSPLANPFTADSSAKVAFYAPDGLYDITVVGNGRTVTMRAQFVSVDGAIVLRSDLAATGGSALVGFQQAGTGAVARTSEEKQREHVSAEDFGAVGDGRDSTLAVQKVIDAVNAAGGGVIEFGPGNFSIGVVTPKSNVTLLGKGAATVITIQQPATATPTGVYLNGGQLENFHCRSIKFDGNRVASSANPNNHIFYLRTNSGADVIRNVTWEECEFVDAQEDSIRILSSTLATIERVYAIRCSFKGAKLGLAGTGGNYPGNGFRFISVAGGYATNYGTVAARFIGVVDCYAEKIRTLADFKRGTGQFVIQGCQTKNMYDCHHSVDGAIGGVIVGNQCYVSPDFDATVHGGSNTNFIEVQGEDILVDGNVGHSDGARMINGILVTDYGYPEEGGVGHRSKNVKLRNNFLRRVSSNAIKIVNGVSCSVEDNTAEDVSVGHLVSVDSGTGRTDGTNPLVAEACFAGGNVGRSVSLGVTMNGRNHTYSPNWDENGQDYYFIPSAILRDALTFANVAVEGGHPQLNSNQHLGISGTGANNLIDFTNAEEAVLAADKPRSAVRGVTLQDTSTTAIREVRGVRFVSAKQNERVYFRLWVKRGTATQCALLVQEWDAAGGFLSSTNHGLSSTPVEWTEYVAMHRASNAACAFVSFALVPAAATNLPANTGTTSFANLRVSKTLVGSDS